jgi:hypothetical protein
MDLRRFVYTTIVKKTKKGNNLTRVRSQVKALLTRSPAFRSLPPDVRREIARDTVKVANYLAGSPTRRGADKPVGEVDFPDFVSSLIKGVFDAIVDGSIKQMEAYAELVAGVTKSLHEFSNANISDNAARDHLLDRLPHFFSSSRGKAKRLPVRLATNRQKLLATMMLMGINRIVVTDGKISAKQH